MADSGSVISWLLDSDPSIHWQVMRDLLDAPESEWRAELAKAQTEGWGARLLSYGRTAADGAYFGVDVSTLVGRLVGERLDDGGWNCERINGSVRSSFATTINVLEGLLEYERATGGTPESREARKSGEEFLLKRHLFRRLSTGEPADEQFLRFVHPNRWRYDILRALDYFCAAGDLTGVAPDPRLGEAVDHVRSRRLEDGSWPLDWSPPGRVWFDVDSGTGKPSRWVTLRAMRVLRWQQSRAGGT
jgi:hypothetical protein